MTYLISAGILLAFALVIFCTLKWWNLKVVGVTPVPLFTFIAILFTSGLDVGLIMFPLAFDLPFYADTETNPVFAFTNPLAIEFGFWGFLIWGFYFLTTFYFCVIEPKVKFFEIGIVKLINNVVIIGTCAFTGYLFLSLPAVLRHLCRRRCDGYSGVLCCDLRWSFCLRRFRPPTSNTCVFCR